MLRPRYVTQDSTQNLREAIAEYYQCNPGLLDPDNLPDGVAKLFRQHDAGRLQVALVHV